MKTAKLVMIGVDPAEFSFIKAHLAELPNFPRALGIGVTRGLRSTSALLNDRDVDSDRTTCADRFSSDRSISGQLRNGRRGNHRADGFLITMGPRFEHGTDAQPLHITELAPIVFERLLSN